MLLFGHGRHRVSLLLPGRGSVEPAQGAEQRRGRVHFGRGTGGNSSCPRGP